MACFLVPAAEAVITTIAAKAIRTHEKKEENKNKISFSEKLGWLNGFLWGGSGLLAFEHLWHGEIVPYFPFLTAASNHADAMVMLHEMVTSGTAMAVLVTAFWAAVCAVSDKLGNKTEILEDSAL